MSFPTDTFRIFSRLKRRFEEAVMMKIGGGSGRKTGCEQDMFKSILTVRKATCQFYIGRNICARHIANNSPRESQRGKGRYFYQVAHMPVNAI